MPALGRPKAGSEGTVARKVVGMADTAFFATSIPKFDNHRTSFSMAKKCSQSRSKMRVSFRNRCDTKSLKV